MICVDVIFFLVERNSFYVVLAEKVRVDHVYGFIFFKILNYVHDRGKLWSVKSLYNRAIKHINVQTFQVFHLNLFDSSVVFKLILAKFFEFVVLNSVYVSLRKYFKPQMFSIFQVDMLHEIRIFKRTNFDLLYFVSNYL